MSEVLFYLLPKLYLIKVDFFCYDTGFQDSTRGALVAIVTQNAALRPCWYYR